MPPALLLVRNFGDATGALVVVVMVLATVGGQLGGALAWLAISGEDAPDLVMTAPVRPLAVTRAKVEAVMGAVLMVLAPFLLVLAWLSPHHAAVAVGGIVVAAASTIRIQLWFRAQAKRSNFRRRHTSSRIATFAEALTSFSLAGGDRPRRRRHAQLRRDQRHGRAPRSVRRALGQPAQGARLSAVSRATKACDALHCRAWRTRLHAAHTIPYGRGRERPTGARDFHFSNEDEAPAGLPAERR